MLLSHPGLGLTASQKARIEMIDSGWQQEKSRLLAAMQRITPTRGRMDQVQAGLHDYSQLSREFDAVREAKWQAAIGVLDSAQQREVKR
ncbi:MAG: hypothetical protein JSS72_07860 [Armatimonadetes bacterium]|nr:hypothetical protein [Armatimonadota bacterium]